MALISPDDAFNILGPILPHLRDSHTEAWDIYQRHISPHMPLATIRGKAGTINELVIERVRQHLPDMPSVVPRDNVCGGRFLLEVDRQVIVYFKKVTASFCTTNNPTENSETFDTQSAIEGFPAWPRVVATYALSEFGTSMQGPYLAFLIGKECQWWRDLNGGGGTGILPFPTPDKQKPDDDEGRLPEIDIDEIDLGGD